MQTDDSIYNVTRVVVLLYSVGYFFSCRNGNIA